MWIYCFLSLLISLDAMDFATAKDPCKTEVSVLGMALKGFVYKKVTVTAPYECDFTCMGERKCQSLNYVIGEKSCELSARTKEARPENFQSDDSRFYMGRFVGRSKHQMWFIIRADFPHWFLVKTLNSPRGKVFKWFIHKVLKHLYSIHIHIPVIRTKFTFHIESISRE